MNTRSLATLLIGAAALLAQKDADALFVSKNWAEASSAYEAKLKDNPADGQSWFRLGESLMELKRYPEAVAAFQKARQNFFRPPLSTTRVAVAWMRAGEPEKAIASLEQASRSGFTAAQLLDNEEALKPLRTHAKWNPMMEAVKRNATPCEYSPLNRQFDYWIGEWNVEVGGSVVGASRIERANGGCTIVENWMPQGGGSGKSLNFFDRSTGKWHQVYADHTGRITYYEGHYRESDKAMVFEAKNAPLKMTFFPLPDGSVRQFLEASSDQGKTWQPAFDGYYKRK
ncbi:MAG: tetratricopeptide repeat protein [Bryobacteraceae bacterium]|nr:tetratricopeptide repeat protein [Bryobacteraceae bacterium]